MSSVFSVLWSLINQGSQRKQLMDPSSARQPQWVGVGWDTLEMGDGRRRVEGGGYLVCMCVREWDRKGWGVDGGEREEGEKSGRTHPPCDVAGSGPRVRCSLVPSQQKPLLVAASSIHHLVTVRQRGASRAPRCSSSAPRSRACPTLPVNCSTLCSKREERTRSIE